MQHWNSDIIKKCNPSCMHTALKYDTKPTSFKLQRFARKNSLQRNRSHNTCTKKQSQRISNLLRNKIQSIRCTFEILKNTMDLCLETVKWYALVFCVMNTLNRKDVKVGSRRHHTAGEGLNALRNELWTLFWCGL